MKKWFDAGYFTMDLMVRRVCDVSFLPLGELCYTLQSLHTFTYVITILSLGAHTPEAYST